MSKELAANVTAGENIWHGESSYFFTFSRSPLAVFGQTTYSVEKLLLILEYIPKICHLLVSKHLSKAQTSFFFGAWFQRHLCTGGW